MESTERKHRRILDFAYDESLVFVSFALFDVEICFD